MGFYYHHRSPEDVQRDNGRVFDFQSIKECYESTKPIRGKLRGHLNIRPIRDRARSWERMVKVSDSEYYVTCDAYRGWEETKDKIPHSRAITFKYNDFTETEYVVVHTPLYMWGEDRGKRLSPRELDSPSRFHFYNYNLPAHMFMENYQSRKYVGITNEDGSKSYFTLNKGDVTFTRIKGEKFYKPLVVHREVTHVMDKDKAKELRQLIKPFVQYMSVMVDMVEGSNHGFYSTNPIDVCGGKTSNYVESKSKELFYPVHWKDLITSPEPTELWFVYAEWAKWKYTYSNYHYQTREYTYEFKKDRMLDGIRKAVYKRAKPLIELPVPLGERVNDKYRNW